MRGNRHAYPLWMKVQISKTQMEENIDRGNIYYNYKYVYPLIYWNSSCGFSCTFYIYKAIHCNIIYNRKEK